MMYDTSAPYPDKPSKSPLMHWLVRNIPGNRLNPG